MRTCVQEMGNPKKELISKQMLAEVFAMNPLSELKVHALLCQSCPHELLPMLMQINLAEGEESSHQANQTNEQANECFPNRRSLSVRLTCCQ